MAEETGNQTSSTAPELTFSLTIHGLTSAEVQEMADTAVTLLNRPVQFTNSVEIFRREGHEHGSNPDR